MLDEEKQMENFIAQQKQLGVYGNSGDDDDDSSLEPPQDEIGNGEILNCLYPGCNKEFTSRWSLTRHTRTHTGERPFKCAVCNKEFVQKCSLKRHEQTHSNDKQWICDFPCCGKRFKLKEYLDVHKRNHSKTESESFPVEDEDQVIQDAADAAGSLIDQLRQRLVRMSVCHHEQLFVYQQREYQLTRALQECTANLETSLRIMDTSSRNGNFALNTPIEIREALNKFTLICNSLCHDSVPAVIDSNME